MAQTPTGPGTRLPQSGSAPNKGSPGPIPESRSTEHASHGGVGGKGAESPRGQGDDEATSRTRLEQGAGRAREEAERIGGQAAEQARGMMDEQKGVFAKEVRGIAQALHKTAEQLGEQDQGPMARYADRAAQGLERFAGSLQARSGENLLQQAQEYARRQPGMFIGGAVALGLVLSRFLKSSAEGHAGSRSPSPSRLSQGARSGEQDDLEEKSAGLPQPSASAHQAAVKQGGNADMKNPGGTDEGR